MKRQHLIAAVLAALLFAPSLALSAPATWTLGGKKAACASGTCDAPTATDGTQGIRLTNVPLVAIQVCADSGQTITGGTGIFLYFEDAASGLWGKFNATAYAVATGARCSWVQGDSPGFGIPILAARGWLAAIPSGITVSSGGVTVWVLPVNAAGQAL